MMLTSHWDLAVSCNLSHNQIISIFGVLRTTHTKRLVQRSRNHRLQKQLQQQLEMPAYLARCLFRMRRFCAKLCAVYTLDLFFNCMMQT